MSGRVTLVGAGPGDPRLLTLRAQAALVDAEVVVVDAGVAEPVLETLPATAEVVRIEPGTAQRSPASDVLRARAMAGQRVVRLVTGDAARNLPELDGLAEAGVAVEVAPGITPAVAAAAYAGIALGAGGMAWAASSMLGAEDWGAADTGGTRAGPVSRDELGRVTKRLIDRGWDQDTPCALVAAATRFDQFTVTGRLGTLEIDAGPQALPESLILVVGADARLAVQRAWHERRPLHGRRVVVTRPRGQVARFAALLEGYGAEVISAPTIRLEPPDDWRPLDEAISRLSTFGWVIFTSVNGVAAFGQRLQHAGLDARALGRVAVAAIGSETAAALAALGVKADLVPSEFRAEGLVEAFRVHIASRRPAGPGDGGSDVLLIRAAEARDVLPRCLAAEGLRVTIVPAYRTVLAAERGDEVRRLLVARQVDVVTFTSSSTARGFVRLLPAGQAPSLLAGVTLAAIGPITAATLAEHQLDVRIVPSEYTASALAAAIAAHFVGRPDGS